MLMLFLLLTALCVPLLGLGSRANLIIGVVLLLLGAIITFGGFDGGLSLHLGRH
jgi:hypothetical protein